MTEMSLSKNKQKRLNRQRFKNTVAKYPQVLEVCRAMVVGVMSSTTTIAVNVGTVGDDGSVEVYVLGKHYRLVLEKLDSPYTVNYGDSLSKCMEFRDFDKALAWYRMMYLKSDPPKLVGSKPLTIEERSAILAVDREKSSLS